MRRRETYDERRSTVNPMLRLIVVLLVVWLVLAMLGLIIKGLFWLAVLGLILFAVTAVAGFFRRGGSRGKG